MLAYGNTSLGCSGRLSACGCGVRAVREQSDLVATGKQFGELGSVAQAVSLR